VITFNDTTASVGHVHQRKRSRFLERWYAVVEKDWSEGPQEREVH